MPTSSDGRYQVVHQARRASHVEGVQDALVGGDFAHQTVLVIPDEDERRPEPEEDRSDHELSPDRIGERHHRIVFCAEPSD